MMRIRPITGVALLAALFAFGCGDEVAEGRPDGGGTPPIDLGDADLGALADLGAPDQGALDLGEGPDLGEADLGGADLGSGGSDAGPSDAGPSGPRSILFVGNSFTLWENIPDKVRVLTAAAGFPEPTVAMEAIGGYSLERHRAGDAPRRVDEGWDAVVLQEFSTRPTDAVGPAERFKMDATWFHDRALDARSTAEVVLYQTWARRAGHGLYPNTFRDPADMLAQLVFHYADAANRAIPTGTSHPAARVRVAPVGQAWAQQLSAGEPPRLHAEDDYHQGPAGAYLNALVLYATLYETRTAGLIPLGVDDRTARDLQLAADRTTGFTAPLPGPMYPMPLAPGDGVRVDLGPTTVSGWAAVERSGRTAGPLLTINGSASGIRVSARGFSGTQNGGTTNNTLGVPAEVSRDTLWVGSFDGHQAASALRAELVIEGLDDAEHQVEIFASRDGNDDGRGRRTRYVVNAQGRELEVADNRGDVARFDALRPDAEGRITIEVSVSPNGQARFAYAGALWIRRVR